MESSGALFFCSGTAGIRKVFLVRMAGFCYSDAMTKALDRERERNLLQRADHKPGRNSLRRENRERNTGRCQSCSDRPHLCRSVRGCRNEGDGSVVMESQGEREDIDAVVEAIAAGRYVSIERMDVRRCLRKSTNTDSERSRAYGQDRRSSQSPI